MSNGGQTPEINFAVDKDNLYREESITDLKVASIRRLIPVKPDGTEDTTRSAKYLGHTQLMSPDGPVPLHAELAANNIEEALDAFPEAMKRSLAEVVKQLQEMRSQQQNQPKEDSRIIVPGR